MHNSIWAIMPEKLPTAQAYLLHQLENDQPEAQAARPQTQYDPGQVRIIPIGGTIAPGAYFGQTTSVEAIRSQYRAALNDPHVGAILFNINSPGGVIDGVPELAQEIYDNRGQKPTLALANGLAASAAYWLATSADEVAMTPSGEVGSIGVFAVHLSYAEALHKEGIEATIISAGKYKVEGNPFQPLDETARDSIQERIDEYYGMFTASVAQGRGTEPAAVKSGFGEGRVVGAKQALASGMVDKLLTLDSALVYLQNRNQLSGRRGEDERPDRLAYRQRRIRALSRLTDPVGSNYAPLGDEEF